MTYLTFSEDREGYGAGYFYPGYATSNRRHEVSNLRSLLLTMTEQDDDLKLLWATQNTPLAPYCVNAARVTDASDQVRNILDEIAVSMASDPVAGVRAARRQAPDHQTRIPWPLPRGPVGQHLSRNYQALLKDKSNSRQNLPAKFVLSFAIDRDSCAQRDRTEERTSAESYLMNLSRRSKPI